MAPYTDLIRNSDANAMDNEISALAQFKDKTLMAELVLFGRPTQCISVR